MKFKNAKEFFSKNENSEKLRLVLLTRCADEDVSGFPRALMIRISKAILDKIEMADALFKNGGFRQLSIDATNFVQPLYLFGDLRPGEDGWTDPCDFSMQFEGSDSPLYFSGTVTDENNLECEDALLSSEITCAEIDSLFGNSPDQRYIKLDARTFAKLEDLESQIDMALSTQVV